MAREDVPNFTNRPVQQTNCQLVIVSLSGRRRQITYRLLDLPGQIGVIVAG